MLNEKMLKAVCVMALNPNASGAEREGAIDAIVLHLQDTGQLGVLLPEEEKDREALLFAGRQGSG